MGGHQFCRETGNGWSNPELTCQQVDPETSLSPGEVAILEVKVLVVWSSLDDQMRGVVAGTGGEQAGGEEQGAFHSHQRGPTCNSSWRVVLR